MGFRTRGGCATSLTLPAKDVYAKPVSLEWGEAANLLLVGTTASEMLDVTGVRAGETVLVHGASGAVGVSLMQQAALIGAHVIGTASEENFDVVRRFAATRCSTAKVSSSTRTNAERPSVSAMSSAVTRLPSAVVSSLMRTGVSVS